MPVHSLLASLLLRLFLTTCWSTNKKDPLLEEAARYHQEATEIQATVGTLDSLKTAFETWEENRVEVPGMPHNHTHKHADATLKDLPADQMRDFQREMLTNIRQIQTRLQTVIK